MQENASPTITKDEIAGLLGCSTMTFQRKRHLLMKDGMPRPIPGLELLWSRRNIMRWIDGDLAPAQSEEHV